MSSRVLLIDGHSMAFRAFYALPTESFRLPSGQHTNAVHGFVSMLISLLDQWQPSHVAVCFDVSRHSFRTDEYADYKGTRGETPEPFKGQVELIKQVLAAFNIAFFEKDQYEADDLIATLSAKSAAKGIETFIVSGDRDSFQLVNDLVTVLYPVKGVSTLNLMTPEAISEKYGVGPSRYPELAALVGEDSDNLPGVPKVGAKTAAKWLAEYDGLDNLLANADQVKGVVGQNLRDHIEDVRRNRRLNHLLTDVEIGAEVADLVYPGYDLEKIHQVFDALEFRTLRTRLLATLPSAGNLDQTAGQYEIDWQNRSGDELRHWLAAETTGLVGLSVKGEFCGGGGEIYALALVNQQDHGCWIELDELDKASRQAVADYLADAARPKALHGAKATSLAFKAMGWQLAGLACDTELAGYLLHPAQRSYSVTDLAIRYLNREIELAEDSASLAPMLDLGLADDGERAQLLQQSRAIAELAVQLPLELAKVGQERLLNDLELPVQSVLVEMEATGIAVDTAILAGLASDFEAQVIAAEQAAQEIIGHEVKMSSPKQLQQVLFEELELPKTRKIRSGYTTDAEAIEQLLSQTGHPFLVELSKYRDAVKLLQSVEGLQKTIAKDGRIHTTFLQTNTATGRLSSKDPNLQNIPIRTEMGRKIRSAFIAGDGYDNLLSADYSQIEMRVMAHASQDEDLINAIRSGADFHAITAAKVYGIEPAQVSPAQRAAVKQMNYGLAYGLSAFGLASRLNLPVSEAQSLVKDYFETFGAVQDYLTGIVKQARKLGYTETILGRRRYLPELTSSDRRMREMAERAALNAPIQGSAADIIKLAMIGVAAELTKQQLKSRLLLQIHDELLFEVAPGEEDQLRELVVKQMGHPVELLVPLDVSMGIGPNWLAAEH